MKESFRRLGERERIIMHMNGKSSNNKEASSLQINQFSNILIKIPKRCKNYHDIFRKYIYAGVFYCT